MNNNVLTQNKQSWDAIADEWFGTTALPIWGCSVPTEDELHLLENISGKKILDIGCGSGHSLKYCGENGAAELYGLDISTRQLENADDLLSEAGLPHTLINQPMEKVANIPTNYFDIVYSDYAIGWTTDLTTTLANVKLYLKNGGIFVFSWDHPFMHCVEVADGKVIFSGTYLDEDVFTFEKGGQPVTLQNRKLSTYINALSDNGFATEKVIEETNREALNRETQYSEGYYSDAKAKHFPLSVIIKARKIK